MARQTTTEPYGLPLKSGAASGIFTWTPTAQQTPGTNVITVRVADSTEPTFARYRVQTPDDVQRGELVYSLPLAPHEKVTLSHKEWSVRESEFSEFVQDSIEHYSERGVAEVDEIAISSQQETRKTERSGLGSSGGVAMTGPADAGSTVVTNTASQQESKRHAQTITSKASSRSVRDHKVSFTVATVAGTEDFTSRLLENRSDDRTMRIDYFRRMKRWRVELFRTGVRLAYDIVIPDPGRRLRLRYELVRKYDRALTATFDPGVHPDDLTRTNWPDYAAAYGVALTAPPADPDASPAFAQWRVKTFATLRDAAYSKFSQVQEIIRQRRAEAARQIEQAADPTALRRLEREEIQRLTLAWLVPGFPGSSSIPSGPTEPQGLSDASWQHALEFGEYIKFAHSAIDWGRLAYFLYPYYWSDRQIERLHLRHPDEAHRDFLRAGAARIVVPIMPGFEDELTSFIDSGRAGKLPSGHRYGPVVAAVREAHERFAAAGNATWHGDGDEDADANESGKVLVAAWTEFTPTGALDIEVVTTEGHEFPSAARPGLVTDAAFEQMTAAIVASAPLSVTRPPTWSEWPCVLTIFASFAPASSCARTARSPPWSW